MNIVACNTTGHKRSNFCKAKQSHWSRQDSFALLLVLLVASVILFPTLGLTGIIDPSEGYYAEAAREMIETGNYIVPNLNYVPWYEKPILAYWLIASSYHILGVSELAARMPSALCGVFLVSYLFLFALRFLSRRTAMVASMVLICSPLFAIVGHLCLTDMPFTLFVTMALGGLFSALVGGPSVFLWLAYVSCGLALLCKGPLALVLVSIVLGAYLLRTCSSAVQWKEAIERLRLPWGIFITSLISVPWYLLVSLHTNGDFVQEFFVRQNLGRATGVVNHKNPIWYYLPYFFIGCAPWSILLLEMAPIWTRKLAKKKPRTLRSKLLCFSTLWLVLFLAFFSFIPTKLGTYILPVTPALAIVVACGLDVVLRLKGRTAFRGLSILVLVLGLGAIFALPVILANAIKLLVSTIILSSIMYLILLVATFLLWRKQLQAFVCGLIVCMLAGLAILLPVGFKAYYQSHQQGFRQLLIEVERAKARVAILGPSAPSAAFYLHRRCPNLRSKEELVAYLTDKKAVNWLLVCDANKAELAWLGIPIKCLDKRGKWSLYCIR